MSQGFSNQQVVSAESGRVVQVVSHQDGEVSTGTVALPNDDTIPQITEGNEVMSLSITPTVATNRLRIDVVMDATHTASSQHGSAALFQDGGSDAIAAFQGAKDGAPQSACSVVFTHWMDAGTTDSTTFTVRGGTAAGATFTFNGQAGTRKFGGVCASSITITEYASGSAALTSNAGKILQVTTSLDTTHTTPTPVIFPFDTTVPQNTEGAELMTASITPTSASSIIKVECLLHIGLNVAAWVGMGLFQDAIAGAVSSTMTYNETATDIMAYPLTYVFTAGTTSQIDFAVRAGAHVGHAIYFNGNASAINGGTIMSSIIITEIAA